MNSRKVSVYIVIGAGSGGCVIAARLSKDANVRVAPPEIKPPAARTIGLPGRTNACSATDIPDQSDKIPHAGRFVAYLSSRRLYFQVIETW